LEIVTPLRSQELPIIYLHAQEHAMNFYQKYGFEAQGDRFYEAGIPHFKMVYRG
jgi:predicted GNAT family N-acyltransferase